MKKHQPLMILVILFAARWSTYHLIFLIWIHSDHLYSGVQIQCLKYLNIKHISGNEKKDMISDSENLHDEARSNSDRLHQLFHCMFSVKQEVRWRSSYPQCNRTKGWQHLQYSSMSIHPILLLNFYQAMKNQHSSKGNASLREFFYFWFIS